MPLGTIGGLALLTIPQLLAARQTDEPTIARLTTVALIPTCIVFLSGPVLDRRFSRKTYAIVATLLATVCIAVAILESDKTLVLGAALFCAMGAASINCIAIGGWFGSLASKEYNTVLGAWMTIANVGSYGLTAIIGIEAIRGLPLITAAALLSAPVLAPLLIYALAPPAPPLRDEDPARSHLSHLIHDLRVLIRRPVVWRSSVMFAAPVAPFALTNTLGALGRDYHASESFVAIVGGLAVTGAGIVGGLITPPLARHTSPRILYLVIGICGAILTLSLTMLPHTPLVLAIAMVGENLAQAAAFATVNIIALQSLGDTTALKATQFGFLTCASALPVTYMQFVDGNAYGLGGLDLMYIADACFGLFACTMTGFLLHLWSTRSRCHNQP